MEVNLNRRRRFLAAQWLKIFDEACPLHRQEQVLDDLVEISLELHKDLDGEIQEYMRTQDDSSDKVDHSQTQNAYALTHQNSIVNAFGGVTNNINKKMKRTHHEMMGKKQGLDEKMKKTYYEIMKQKLKKLVLFCSGGGSNSGTDSHTKDSQERQSRLKKDFEMIMMFARENHHCAEFKEWRENRDKEFYNNDDVHKNYDEVAGANQVAAAGAGAAGAVAGQVAAQLVHTAPRERPGALASSQTPASSGQHTQSPGPQSFGQHTQSSGPQSFGQHTQSSGPQSHGRA
jgi:hypothetical protein